MLLISLFSDAKRRGMQSQVVCSGCRSLLMYPSGATNVCCAVCNSVTTIPPQGYFWISNLVSNSVVGAWMCVCVCVMGKITEQPNHELICKAMIKMELQLPLLVLMNGNGPTDMWRLQYVIDVYTGCYQCEMFLLPHSKPSTRWEMLGSHFPCIGQSVLPLQHRCLLVQRLVLIFDHVFLEPECFSNYGSMQPLPNPQSQTVVVENPMSVDKSGKLVSNVVVGVTTDKK
ncbi:hypothetical protein SASPL_112120 [Salvia splendens]|uniref:Zinc finger LSD1-type domain-containing protein n=1 Tax=Salvia splendens TaxID=180675 RepID=A0A8X9A4A1_SALSN|nr:hypothetical protein SASPL_112120 [Salvia splendens]